MSRARGCRPQQDAARGRLQAAVRGLHPGYFALVMATGVLSVAVAVTGAPALSAVLLIVAVVCYLVLAAGYGWRLVSYRREFLADAGDPRKAFAFFTFVAGSDVLGDRLAMGGQAWACGLLLAVAAAAWLVLSYVMPLGLVTGHGAGSALAGVNGTWFLWVVGTQSLVVSLSAFPAPVAGYVTALAVGLWSVGVLLYLLIAGLVLAGLLHFPVDPGPLTPAYWVFMGATAISVLAGARVLSLPAQPLLASVRPVLAGLSVLLWAFGTWLIPLLIGLGVWRHLLRRVPLRYEPGLWSMVFPLGMYSVASWELGLVLHVQWLTALGSAGAWVAFAVWAAVFAAMLASLVSLARSR